MDMRKSWNLTALALFVGALVWPTLAGALMNITLSPYERALQTARCGDPLRETYVLLGHCATCWIGSAALLIAAVMVCLASRAIASNASTIASPSLL